VRTLPRVSARIVYLAMLTGCAPLARVIVAPPPAPTPPSGPEGTFPHFMRLPQRPAVSTGRAGLPVIAFDPAVFVDEEGYHLFYTTIFCRGDAGYSYTWDPADQARCNIMNAIGSIGYAFSGDKGLTWRFRRTPVILPGSSGFDSRKIETAFVFRVRDTLYMAYSAVDCLENGKFDEAKWQKYREVFATHVVED